MTDRICRALGIDAAAGIGDALRPGMGLLLDNAEEALPVLEAQVPGWAQAAPASRIWIASRSRPAHARIVEVPPLEVEASAQLLASVVERPITSTGARRIVEELEGLPLAITLAAARLRTLATRELLEELRVARRQPGSRDPMRAAMRTSWALLSAETQSIAGRLATIPGQFDRALAEAVGGPRVMDALEELRDAALLRVEAATEVRATQYSLLRALRGLALPEASERGDAWRAMVRHLGVWGEALRGGAPSGAAARFVEARIADHQVWAAVAIDEPDPPSVVFWVLAQLVNRFSGEQLDEWSERGVTLARRADRNEVRMARATVRLVRRYEVAAAIEEFEAMEPPLLPAHEAALGVALARGGRLDEGEEQLRGALARAPAWQRSRIYSHLGSVLRWQGRHSEAIEAYQESILQASEDPDLVLPLVWMNLGIAFAQVQRLDEALRASDVAVDGLDDWPERRLQPVLFRMRVNLAMENWASIPSDLAWAEAQAAATPHPALVVPLAEVTAMVKLAAGDVHAALAALPERFVSGVEGRLGASAWLSRAVGLVAAGFEVEARLAIAAAARRCPGHDDDLSPVAAVLTARLDGEPGWEEHASLASAQRVVALLRRYDEMRAAPDELGRGTS